MGEFYFARGEDYSVKLAGEYVGGIKKVNCARITNFYDIKEFLTDTPVYRVASTSYELVLSLNFCEECIFDNTLSFDSIVLESEKHTEVFSDCTVSEITSQINAKGLIEKQVKIIAESRSVN